MGKFICPFCFSKYSKRKVLYECSECGAKYIRGKIPKNFNVTASKISIFTRTPIKCTADRKNENSNANAEDSTNDNTNTTHICNGIANNKKCLACGKAISDSVLQNPNLPFSIIGMADSGKTNYITVMLEELKNSDYDELVLTHLEGGNSEIQDKNYDFIYKKHRIPGGTNPGDPPPQIWRIQKPNNRNSNYTYTFTIFDGAGEDYERINPTSKIYKYILESKAIIFTINPMSLPNIKYEIDTDTIRKSSSGGNKEQCESEDGDITKTAYKVITNVIMYIKKIRGIKKDTAKLKIPVAVVLTKFDTIMNHKDFPAAALVKQHSSAIRNNTFNGKEFDQIDREIRDWLRNIGENKFIKILDTNLKNYHFFGVSSYGSVPPEYGETPKDIKPHRVLDPLLWLFKNAKFID